jgi:hypothetical protein
MARLQQERGLGTASSSGVAGKLGSAGDCLLKCVIRHCAMTEAPCGRVHVLTTGVVEV